jgi:hypothetical protein
VRERGGRVDYQRGEGIEDEDNGGGGGEDEGRVNNQRGEGMVRVYGKGK